LFPGRFSNVEKIISKFFKKYVKSISGRGMKYAVEKTVLMERFAKEFV
jgi:hypothetical protein